MQVRTIGFAIAAAALLASPASPAAGQTAALQNGTKDGIVGSDVMGDRNRTGPDGWSQAPTTRDQSAAGQAPGETAENVKKAPNALPNDTQGKRLAPGDDPGTPATAESHGPGTIERPAAAR